MLRELHRVAVVAYRLHHLTGALFIPVLPSAANLWMSFSIFSFIYSMILLWNKLHLIVWNWREILSIKLNETFNSSYLSVSLIRVDDVNFVSNMLFTIYYYSLNAEIKCLWPLYRWILGCWIANSLFQQHKCIVAIE